MQKIQNEVAFDSFLKLAERIGSAAPYWCQGDSGYISVKYGPVGSQSMVVNKPGVRIADIGSEHGWHHVDIKMAMTPPKDLVSGWSDAVHAHIHAMFRSRIVVELTSLAALLMAHEHQDDMNVACWLAERLRRDVAIVSYPKNADALIATIRSNIDAAAIVIANYGVILHSDDVILLDSWHAVEREFCERLGYLRLLRQLAGASAPDLAELATPKRNYLGGPVREKCIPSSALVEAAVSSRSVKKSLEKQYVLQSSDKDVAELWRAHQLLYSECPTLRELPLSASGSFVHRGRIPLQDELAFRRR